MARQDGLIQASGKLDNVEGFRRKNKHHFRKAVAPYMPPAESLKAASEFGRSVQASSLVRRALPGMFEYYTDGEQHNRLASRLRKIIRSGEEAKKGQRHVEDGPVSWLRGFTFNPYCRLHRLTWIRPRVTISADGSVAVTLPATPQPIVAPEQASQAIIRVTASCLNFREQTFVNRQSADLVIHLPVRESRQMTVKLRLDAEGVILVGMSIFFTSNGPEGEPGVIRNRKHIAADILEAALIRDGKVHPGPDFEKDLHATSASFEPMAGAEWVSEEPDVPPGP